MREDMRLPTVLLVDDHVVFTDGVVRLLDGRYEVVGTIADGTLLIETVARLRPDVIVMDISMPKVSGIEAMRRPKATHAREQSDRPDDARGSQAGD
jgi:two-component system response regulator NreC